MSTVKSLSIPTGVRCTENLTGSVGGRPAELLETGTGPALMIQAPGGYSLELCRPDGWEGLRVAPARAQARFRADSRVLTLECPGPDSLLLEIGGVPVACVLVVPPAGDPPKPGPGGRLIEFPAGDVTDIGSLSLKSGDVLWVPGGAAIRGQIIASEAEDIVIGGGGILDASLQGPKGETLRPVVIDNCRRVRLGNLTIINGRHWMVSIGRCEDVVIEGTRQFSNRNGTDGIDIVGSRRVTVRGCFLRNGDDNVAIKALDVKGGTGVGQHCPGNYKGNWEADVSDILVEGCAFFKDHGGSAMEIGYETRAARIANITFRDIDVMAVHQFGSVFGIHNGDRAIVENVVWENIRVEHHFDKLVDFRVLHSRWNTDSERGQIRNVVLRNIEVAESAYNPGYTVSLIAGFDAGHAVKGVHFENFLLGGDPVMSADRLSLLTRHAEDITFSGDSRQAASVAEAVAPVFPPAARWISSDIVGGPKECAPACHYRKSFHLSDVPRQAILTITARGIYEFQINGKSAHDDVFSPGWTDYRKRILVRSYDVTTHLLAGENVLGITLGDGWYCGYLAAQDRQFYGDRPSVIAGLHVIGSDGSETDVVTDSSWITGSGGIRQGDYFMGEIHDARMDNPGWSAPGAVLEGWSPAVVVDAPAARLLAAEAPPVKRMEVLPGKPLPLPAEAASVGTGTLWDIGENIAGRARIRFRGEPGRVVTIRYAEILDDSGRPYFGNLRRARATDEYTFRSHEEVTWEPRFTFHGFRYVEIRSEAEIKVLAVDGIVLYSEMQAAGTFDCSDPDLNQLFRNILRSQKGNFIDVPTDCPQRDERLGWTADAQVFIRTATHNFDCRRFFLKWIDDLVDAQHANGAIPPFAPDTRSFGLPEDGGAAWADAAFICPWTLYQVYGDSEPLAKAHAMMVRYMDYLGQYKVRDGIRPHPDLDEWGGFGDWLAPERNGLPPGETPKDLIGTVFYVNNARILAATSQILGKSGADRWSDLADRSAEAFRNRFLNPDGSLRNPTQTGCVLALHFDMLLPWQRTLVFRQLVERIEAHENHIGTGFVGTPYILHVLEAGGRLDLAYRLLLNTECPSWLYSVRQGATSIWERWDGWTRERGFADPGMNSYNHYAYGAVGDWLVRSVAGLELDAPGFSRILFKPRPGGGLTHASASYETRHGLAAISWRRDSENTLTLDLTVPAGTSARLDPGTEWATDGPAEFPAGTFRITARAGRT